MTFGNILVKPLHHWWALNFSGKTSCLMFSDHLLIVELVLVRDYISRIKYSDIKSISWWRKVSATRIVFMLLTIALLVISASVCTCLAVYFDKKHPVNYPSLIILPIVLMHLGVLILIIRDFINASLSQTTVVLTTHSNKEYIIPLRASSGRTQRIIAALLRKVEVNHQKHEPAPPHE